MTLKFSARGRKRYLYWITQKICTLHEIAKLCLKNSRIAVKTAEIFIHALYLSFGPKIGENGLLGKSLHTFFIMFTT